MNTNGLSTRLLATGALLVACAMSVSAQEEEAQTYGADAVYFRVLYVEYRAGKADEAYRIIDEHFRKAGAKAGLRDPLIVHFQTGPWDVEFHTRLENGYADLEWRVSPNNMRFMKALSAQEGGPEAARALLEHYQSLIARSTSAIGHRHMSEDAG